jgi:hypothetical protein
VKLDFAHTQAQPEGVAQQIPDLRWRWDILCNPKGIESFSPGLRGTSYPGFKGRKIPQPYKGCVSAQPHPFSPPFQGNEDHAVDRRSNPFRADTSSDRTPRVARASQPWAERSHPFRMTADLPRL